MCAAAKLGAILAATRPKPAALPGPAQRKVLLFTELRVKKKVLLFTELRVWKKPLLLVGENNRTAFRTSLFGFGERLVVHSSSS